MLRFRPAFCFTLRPGLAVVPLADLVMRFTRRSSMATQPWLLVRSVVSLWVKSCRRRACRARSLAISAMVRRRARATGPSWGAGSMERRRLADIIAFDPRRMAKHRVFETDRTITDLYCLDQDQEQLLLVHEASDKVLVAMAGRVLVRVEDESAEIGQYEAVLVPAGAKHALKNLGPDPAVLLVFLAPRLA